MERHLCYNALDMLTMARFHSTDELFRFVQNEMPKIHGIRDSETFLCLDMREAR